MTATTHDECVLKWCNEAGDHNTHRQYLASMAVERGGSVVGVNLVDSGAGLPHVELTVVPRHGASVVLTLNREEAADVGDALIQGASRPMLADVAAG